MGILNVTPDSFSDGGRYYHDDTAALELERACACARGMTAAGAGIIDVGGESTRPGSEEVSAEVELARVEPVVRALVHEGLIVSIDTRHAEVAAACVKRGASVINDVTGFTQADMREVARRSEAGCMVVHMQGEPKSMQHAPHYDDVVQEVESFLLAQACVLRENGIARDRIVLDPGPGFGKSFEHNLALLRATARLSSHGYPLVAAWSRKAFIGALAGASAPDERVAGSVEVAVYAALHGARILRVHDVAPTAQALDALAQGSEIPGDMRRVQILDMLAQGSKGFNNTRFAQAFDALAQSDKGFLIDD